MSPKIFFIQKQVLELGNLEFRGFALDNLHSLLLGLTFDSVQKSFFDKDKTEVPSVLQ
jgi:hypothetical protein